MVQPWSRPLYPKYNFLVYKKLREEQLVPDDLDTVLSTLPTENFDRRRSRIRILYTLNDTFIIDFSSIDLFFFVITEHDVPVVRLSIRNQFFDGRAMCMVTPYTGAYTNHLSILLY